jgi:hypothetical protein
MNDYQNNEIRDLWNRVADDWRIQVGTRGDSNRFFTEDRYHLAGSPAKLYNSKNRPYSVAFKLQKI